MNIATPSKLFSSLQKNRLIPIIGFMRIFLLSLLCFLTLVGFTNPPQEPPLIISLGAWCHTANALKACGLKKETYPFDWLVSPSHETLIQILDSDFEFFADKSYFRQRFEFPLSPNTVENSYYGILFHHDTPAPYSHQDGESYEKHLEAIAEKYARRIERFRKLREYPAKVFFIRNPYWTSAYEAQNNEAYALQLRDALRRFFPKLNFTLVIVNAPYLNVPPVSGAEGILEFQENDFNSLVSRLFNESGPVAPKSFI